MPLIDGTGKSRLLELDERVDPSRTALLLIDVQTDFCEPTGAYSRIGEDISAIAPMLDRIRNLLAVARQANMLIIFLRSSFDKSVIGPALGELNERRKLGHGVCVEGTAGIQFCEGTGPAGLPNEIVVTKHRASAWSGTELDLVLRSNGIKSLVLTGVETEVSIESTARDAFFKDYYVVIATEAVAGYSKARHDAALKIIGHTFGRVVPTAQIEEVWSKAPTKPRNWSPERKQQLLPRSFSQRLDPAETAIILINVQNDFCSEGGTFTQQGHGLFNIRRALPGIQELLAAGRAAGCLVAHVKSEYGQLTRNAGAPYSQPATNMLGSTATLSAAQFAAGDTFDHTYVETCQPNSWGGDFVDGFDPQNDELLIVKHRISAFADTRLDLLLRSNGIRSVVIAGVTTNCCVESAVRDACMFDYYATVAEDAVAVPDDIQHLHRASLDTMTRYFAKVTSVKSIAATWSNVERGAA